MTSQELKADSNQRESRIRAANCPTIELGSDLLLTQPVLQELVGRQIFES